MTPRRDTSIGAKRSTKRVTGCNRDELTRGWAESTESVCVSSPSDECSIRAKGSKETLVASGRRHIKK
jgi:hypothetical protein